MDFPIEYRERMLAEQMAMMEALQFIAQLLIYFVLLLAFVFLIVNLSGIVWVRLSERRTPECRQPQIRAARRRSSAIPLEQTKTDGRKEMTHDDEETQFRYEKTKNLRFGSWLADIGLYLLRSSRQREERDQGPDG
jgi:hypothetical protein